jgi:hypothetical protein
VDAFPLGVMFALCGAFLLLCAFLQQGLLELAAVPEHGNLPGGELLGGRGSLGGASKDPLLQGAGEGGGAGGDSRELVMDLGRGLAEVGVGTGAGHAAAKGTALRPLPSKRPAAL